MVSGRTTLRLDADPTTEALADAADRAITALDAGETVIVPTDTVYGIAARLDRPAGIEQLFACKGRDRSNPLAVLVADAAQAEDLLDLTVIAPRGRAAAAAMMAAVWPGALTVVGPRAPRWRHVDLGGDATTVGVRVPNEPIVRAITAQIGPIVTTSANRSGEPTPTDAATAARSLTGEVAVVIDTGAGGGLASTVVDVAETPFRLLRLGALDPAALGIDPQWLGVASSTVPVKSGAHHE